MPSFTRLAREARGTTRTDGRLSTPSRLHGASVLTPLLALIVLGLFFAPSAGAQAQGSLDTSFGTGGKQTTDFGGGPDIGQGSVVQPDGKIVVVGHASGDFALARYNADGSLDTSFGDGGKQTTDIAGGYDQGRALAVQPDGKIVVAGYTDAGGGDFALARYNADGSLDTSFGDGGKQTTDFGDLDNQGNALALQPDGKIVVAGSTSGEGGYDFALARYNADGSLDTTFGDGGKQTTDFAGLDNQGNALALQPDGKIVVAGHACVFGCDFALARYNADGSLDTTFGDGGKQTTDFGDSYDQGHAVAVQPDGKIVVAGFTDIGGGDFALARYNADGSLDMSFGDGGKQTTDFGGDEFADAEALDPDDKIVAAGYACLSSCDFVLTRYNADGSLDTTFGDGGKQTTDFGSDEFGSALAVQSDGKMIVAGYADAGGGDFALARYNGDTPPDTTAPETSITEGPSGTTDDSSPSFSFEAESGSTFECRLDVEVWDACGSPKTLSNLSDGEYTFEVRASDEAANADLTPASRTFTVETTPPSPARDCTISGTSGGDTIGGTSGDDVICARQGNDIVYASGGNDTLYGRHGNDMLQDEGGEDRLDGGPGRDILHGGRDRDFLSGRGGDDHLFGEAANDRLLGGAGADELSGQDGADSLVTRDGVERNDAADGGASKDACATDRGDSRTSC